MNCLLRFLSLRDSVLLLSGGDHCKGCDLVYDKPYMLLSGAYDSVRARTCKQITGFRDITDYVECGVAAAAVGLNPDLKTKRSSTSYRYPGYCSSNTDGGFQFNTYDTSYSYTSDKRIKRICANTRLVKANCSDGLLRIPTTDVASGRRELCDKTSV